MYSLNTNIDALNARNAARVSSESLSQSLRRLSTGLRINSSVDDSAGLIEANRLRGDSETLRESLKNANNTIAMFQIIDKALDQQITLLDTIRAKAIQAATDGQSKISREALQKEVEGLLKELDNISKETSFGNQNLLDGTFFNKRVQIGKDSSSVLDFSFNATSSDKMGFSSYKTTQGGQRLISDLSLTFKNTGTSNEDVTLAPFTLSTSPGKTIVDLANFVNKYSEDTGVRAIYKEGNTLPVFKRNSLKRDLIAEQEKKKQNITANQDPIAKTTSSYIQDKFISSDKIKVSDISFSNLPATNTEQSINDGEPIIQQEDLDYNIELRAFKPTILTPLGKTFYENVYDENLFTNNTLIVKIVGDKLAPGISSAKLASAIGVENMPDYLEMKFEPSVDRKEIRLTIGQKAGVAIVPVVGDQIVGKIRLKFNDPDIFTSKVAPDDVVGFNLNYATLPRVHYNTTGNFQETSVNEGIYGGVVTMQLQGATFKAGATSADIGKFIQLSRIPAFTDGAVPTVISTKVSPTKFTIELKGGKTGSTARGANDDITLEVKPVVDQTKITEVTAYNNLYDVGFFQVFPNDYSGDTYIDMLDKPTVEVAQGWTEHSNNDGTISTSVILKISGDTWDEDLTSADLKAKIPLSSWGWAGGVDPAGLEVQYKKANSNEIIAIFSKQATANDVDLAYTGVVLPDELFTKRIKNTTIETAGSIDFLKEPTIGQTANFAFSENSIKPGEISGTMTLSLTNGEVSFNDANLKDNIEINLPDGLTPSFAITDNNQKLEITIDGTATDHSLRKEAIKIGFKREAFNSNVYSTAIDTAIDFYDSAYVIADGPLKEGALNDGSIAAPIKLTLKNNEEFNAAVLARATPVLVDNTDYEISGLPDGFTSSTLTVLDNKNVSLMLVGKADTHVEYKNIKVSLKGSILKSGIDAKAADVRIEFKKASRIIQIGEIKESAANNGKISSKVTFELTDGSFKDPAVAANAPILTPPAGLTAVWTRDAATPGAIVLEFTGDADAHASFNSTQLDIDFKNAIEGGGTDTVGLDTYTTNITFIDELPKFIKLGGEFIENSKNNGQISGTVGLELPSGIDFEIDKYNDTFIDTNDNNIVKTYINNPDKVHPDTKISLNTFLRRNIKASNLPYIVETSYKIDPLNPRRLLVSFLQNDENLALNHGPDDSTSFRLNFNSGLFKNNANVDDVSLDIRFYDTAEVIAFGKFQESSRNDGSTDDYLELSVIGDSFARVNPNNHIKVTGIPNSLIPKFVTDGSSIRFYLEGRSKKHDEFDDFNNIELEFLTNSRGESPLFENGIKPANLKGIRFDFKNQPIPQIEENFQESFSNDGSIGKPVTITLKDGYFKTNVDPSKYARMTRIPPGLKDTYKVLDETSLEIRLTGNAFNHSLSESVTNSELELDPDLFVSGIRPPKLKNIGISFLGSPNILYSGGFTENEANDGSVSGTVVLSLEKDTFREGLALDNYIILGNLPAGLTPKYAFKNETTIEFTLEGRAINHTDFNDVKDLSVSFTSDLFTQKVLPDNKIEDIVVNFKDSPKIFYNDYFKESPKNNGAIRNIITLDLFGDNFTAVNPNANGVINVRNLPSGLTPLFTRTKANQMTLQLLGQSTNHKEENAVKNIAIEFTNQLFRNGVAPANLEELIIDYRDRPILATTDKFRESSFNDGSFNEPVTFNLTGDTFNKKENPNDVIFIKNLPAGLNSKFTILNDSQIELVLEGKAIKHDVSAIKPELVFQDPKLFFSGIAPADLVIKDFDFVKAPQVTLESEFTESFLNDGTIASPVLLSVLNTEFVNKNSSELGKLISISNLPSGLEPVFVKIEDKIQLTLRGTAVKHTNLYDVRNLRLEFSQELFKSGVSANVIENGVVNFREPPRVNTISFVESEKNDGSITDAITLEVSDDDKFNNIDLAASIKVISPPDGLIPKFTFIDERHIAFKLENKANNHENIHDLDNMTLEFDPALFESGQKADPITNLVVDFKDPPPPVVEAKKSVFEESEANDGSIEKAIDFSVKFDTISDVYNFKYSSTVKDIKKIIGGGNNLILNGINIRDLNVDNADFYPSLIKKINNKGNGTGGIFAKLVGTDIRLFKDFQNTVNLEGNGGNIVADNDDAKIKKEFVTKNMMGHLIEVTGMPSGLVPEYKYASNSLFSVKLIGNANNHLNKHDTDRDDIQSLKFKFKPGLFSRNVQGKDLNDVSVNFNDPTVEFSDSFRESKLDDGSIANKITITLFGDKFHDETALDKFITANNVPKGLKPVFVRLSDTKIEMSLEGNATKHLDEHDINNITLGFSKDLFAQGLAIYPKNKLSIDFNDPPDPVYVPGGPGAYGGYITFVSDRSSDLIIESGDANFGVNDSKYSTTLNLRDAITKKLTSKDLYGMGYTDDVDYALHEGTLIQGVNHKQSSLLVMDAVDSALEYLKKMRAKVASLQNQVEKRVEYLNVERVNIRSAESAVREIDFAEETANFQKRNLLTQAGNYAISQANASKKMILSLLQQ